jgi:hyperosmotically inducible protein
MKSIVLSAFVLAMAGNVAVAADSDDRVEEAVTAKLSRDARLKGQKVKVDVDEGVAKLDGKVASAADRTRAARLAAAVAGVVRVENNLEVDTGVAKDRVEANADRTKEVIDDRADRTKERVDENAERAKDRVDERARANKESLEHKGASSERAGAPAERRSDSAGTEVSDSWITTKVKTSFVGVDALEGSDIHVDTDRDGAVTLRGTVPNETARARAVEITRSTKGVRRVVDELRLSPRR